MKRFLAAMIALILLFLLTPINTYAENSYPVVFISEDCSTVGEFSEGLLLAIKTYRQGVNYTYKYGFLDKTGNIAIPFTYDKAEKFSNGLAAISKDGKFGYIDKTGKVVIPLTYDSAMGFSEGLARVTQNKKWYFIDKTGKALLGPFRYDNVGDFKDGFAKIKVGVNEKTGLIDRKGKEVVPPVYSTIGEFHEGLAQVWDFTTKKCGMINTSGKVAIPLIYDGIGDFADGVANASKNHKCGVINNKGKVVLPFKYGNVDNFSYGLAHVTDTTDLYNWKHGFVDKTGKFIIPMSYNWYELCYTDGLAAVAIKNKTTGKYQVGFIDTKGKSVIKPKYGYMTTSRVHTFENGFAIVSDADSYEKAKYGIIDKKGKEIVPIIYDRIGDNVSIYPAFHDGIAIVCKDGKTGAVDTTGKFVIPMIFNTIGEFRDGLALANLDGTKCIIENPIKNTGKVK